MSTMIDIRAKPAKCRRALVMACTFLSLSSSGGMAQFYATQEMGGDMAVFDASGLEVPIAPADPVGTRPSICPSDAYYVSEMQTDKTELVLTDCATDMNHYTVELQGLTETTEN